MLRNTCTQAAIRFPKRPFIFYSKIQNSIIVLKLKILLPPRNTEFRNVSFVIWTGNTKFLKFFRNSRLLFANKLKNLKSRPNCYSFFWPQSTKSEFVLKQPFAFWIQTTKIELNYLLFQWTFKGTLMQI